MTFACPGCGCPVSQRPTRWALRCPACRALLRSEPVDTSGESPAYEVAVAGRPETRRRVEVSWDESERLLWSSAITLALVLVLFFLARLL